MDRLKVLSYNVKGLHGPVKRKKILHQMKQANCHIAFLQETHSSDAGHEKLKRSWADKVYLSSHRSGRKEDPYLYTDKLTSHEHWYIKIPRGDML